MSTFEEVLRKQIIKPKNIHIAHNEVLKNITQFFDHKTVMELCNKTSPPSIIKTISKKQLFFKAKLGSKHDNSLLKFAKKIFFPVSMSQFYSPLTSTKTCRFFS